jgi:1-pyrroline-5-carboxylate dehydrogenase
MPFNCLSLLDVKILFMSNAIFNIPNPVNEPVKNYAPKSMEREELKKMLKTLKSSTVDIPMHIGGKEVRTKTLKEIRPPHETKHLLGVFHYGTKQHVLDAIKAALKAKKDWENLPWESRASIFLKAAELISTTHRAKINAATMLGQSKNVYQAEIDAACEFADFLRFNVQYMVQIYEQQPISSPGIWNKLEYRPLEGFVFALSPFNFTAIAGNLPASAALMGNTVVWKPADTQAYSAQVIMEIFKEAGLPDGVINLIYGDGPDIGDVVFKHPDLAGVHFTGSTAVFQTIWREIGKNIHLFKSYPRIVGETGGKDFIMAHPSAHAKAVSTAISRGSFEYQGQKCSAASRVYIPSNLFKEIQKNVLQDIHSFKMGSVENFSNFINAVIDDKAFTKISGYISQAKKDKNVDIIAGGGFSKKEGYFIEPTVLLTQDPMYRTMCEEIFGPVVSIYVYPEKKYEETLELVNNTSPYSLTGALFSQDRYALEKGIQTLRHAAGNFYINDKPTGAVVGQQPFGGGRASGTNDKAGSYLNLLRWVSPRTIKETLVAPTDYRYPFLMES